MFSSEDSVTAYLLYHGSVSYASVARLSRLRWSRSESESDKGDLVTIPVATHEQAEAGVMSRGGPNSVILQN